MRNTKANVRNASAPLWSAEQTAELKGLWKLGFTGGQIAKRIGRTRGQVMGRLSRLGLLGKISEREWGPITDAEVKRRIRICRECVKTGLSTKDAAKALDLGYHGLIAFLKKYDEGDLRTELAANSSAAAWRTRKVAA